MKNTQKTPDHRLELMAMILMGWAGAFFVGAKPLILSAYKDHLGFGDDLGGYIVAIETTGNFLGALFVISVVQRWNRRVLGMVALVLILLANLASFLLDDFSTLVGVRFIAGCGSGLAAGIMSASIAGTVQPDRNFAIYTTSILAALTAGFMIIPLFLDIFGMNGIFILLIIILIPAVITLSFLPRFGPNVSGMSGSSQRVGGSITLKWLVMVVAGTILAYIGIGGFSPFMGEIAKVSGLDGQYRANVLAVAQFFGVLGALAAILQGLRWGRVQPVVTGLLCMAVSVIMILIAPNNALVFAISAAVFLFMWLYFFAYFAGVTSALDPTGRITVLFFSVSSIGFGVGPAINGWIAKTTGGYTVVEYVTIGCLLASLLFIAPVTRYQAGLKNWFRRS